MKYRALFLLALGVLQMAGDVFRVPAIKAIGQATGASPAPKVFSSVKGLETFSSTFYLEWADRAGSGHTVELTPELYSKVQGPYNRRNVFGAVLSYAPVLQTDPHTALMFQAVVDYSFCGQAPLLREIGVDPASISGGVRVRIVPRPGTPFGDTPYVFVPGCR
jgi:hypothetical protein